MRSSKGQRGLLSMGWGWGQLPSVLQGENSLNPFPPTTSCMQSAPILSNRNIHSSPPTHCCRSNPNRSNPNRSALLGGETGCLVSKREGGLPKLRLGPLPERDSHVRRKGQNPLQPLQLTRAPLGGRRKAPSGRTRRAEAFATSPKPAGSRRGRGTTQALSPLRRGQRRRRDSTFPGALS